MRSVVFLGFISSCALGLRLPSVLWAGKLPLGPEGYSSRVWHVQDGLPEDTIQALAQTSDGYLWIGTSGGLVRSDGVQFALFNRENTAAFSENSITALAPAKDGGLWIGTQGAGLPELVFQVSERARARGLLELLG